MKFIFCNRNILFFILVLSTFSCTSDLDFEQANDFNIQPVVTTNLAYFQGKAPDFVENGIEIPAFSYTANTDFFDTSFVEEDLVKAELYFRIKNTINRGFTFYITFLDAKGTPIKNLKIDVLPAVNGSEVVKEHTEPFNVGDVAILKKTTKMAFSIIMLSGPPLTETSPGRVELSSSATAYFDVK